MNISISITGIITPMIEYISGFEELRHIRHHTTLNTIAIIIIRVPIPIPNTFPLDWQLTKEKRVADKSRE
jgi:hypothetical protein